LVPLWTIAIYIRCFRRKKTISLDVVALRNKYLSLQPPIPRSKEKLIPIREMYIYPVRGVRAGAEVESLELGMHGAKYDREILLAAKDDKAIVTTNKYHVMGCLRQKLSGSVVTVYSQEPEKLRAKGLPETISIDLKENPESVGPYLECQKGYFGYQYEEDVCAWFSAAIDKQVVAIRSPLRRRTRLNPKRLLFDRHDDLRKSFCTDAAFHVINKTSVDVLRQKMKERHPEGLSNFFVSTE